MHIKQLTVHGFKSYRDETVFGPFSAGHNVIVGRNGSGKSNFFAAIRFVLHDAYARLGGSEERQALLHDGANVSAYVELVLDNSDQRFPTGRPEVRIRRTVGVKKDEYSVDERAVAKGEVQRMLQTAGFSPSNPYYIVPQGRVTALTNARDEERLAVLKEVAGTRTYEEHRAESLRILEETRGKRERIGELLSYISSRLGDLQQEKEALQHWQHLERRRRTLQRKVYSGELALIDNELMETDAQVGSTDESEPTDGNFYISIIQPKFSLFFFCCIKNSWFKLILRIENSNIATIHYKIESSFHSSSFHIINSKFSYAQSYLSTQNFKNNNYIIMYNH